jgi:hypothetical protein
MPKVKTKSGKTVHLPYTPEGMAQAAEMKKKVKKPKKGMK